MTTPEHYLAVFLADLSRLVEGMAETGAALEGRRFAGLVRGLRCGDLRTATAATAFGLPVCRFWEPALRAAPAQAAVGGMIQALRALGPLLVWIQNPNYRGAPPSGDFLDNYGYAVIAGPRDGSPALVHHDTLKLGALSLGPRTHYPLHHHPATEIYVPFNRAEWWRGEGPWREQPPGAVIFHPSEMPHATRTGGEPLLAVYLWSGNLGTHARLSGAGSTGPDWSMADGAQG